MPSDEATTSVTSTKPKAKVRDQLSYGEFDVWIEVDGDRAPIYGAKRESAKGLEVVMTCWIASAEGKEFSISFQRTEFDDYDFRGIVAIDGNVACASVYRNEDEDAEEPQTVSGSRISLTEEQNFVFGKVELTDDESKFDDSTVEDIGTIEVILEKIDITRVKRTKKPYVFGVPIITKVHERSKKGLDHQIKYGPIEVCEPLDDKVYTFTDWGDKTTFIFKYRSLETLQAMGVAPRSKSTGLPSLAPVLVPTPAPAQVPQAAQAPTRTDANSEVPFEPMDTLVESDNRCSRKITSTSVKRDHSVKLEHSASEGRLRGADTESDSEDEDIREMLATAHRLLEKVESTRSKRCAKKKEKLEDTSRAKKRAKTEPKIRHFAPGEIIDLT
ncbi:hypothetical protein BDN70DRAFT_997952 [Pholiota conissans]|uniref:DUF7918 domain-containing protein n=1 Tax=Pholiota conissans TaxID=109636 RepID=A0A9P6CUS1_9AGAR|nr:hypothetical protein BDN70DRAFT_997952 [Pholiota conissans]